MHKAFISMIRLEFYCHKLKKLGSPALNNIINNTAKEKYRLKVSFELDGHYKYFGVSVSGAQKLDPPCTNSIINRTTGRFRSIDSRKIYSIKFRKA